MFELSDDVKVPTKKGQSFKYPFPAMKVGQSFEIPLKKITTVRNNSFRYGRSNNKKFTVRKLENGTYRCWRIE